MINKKSFKQKILASTFLSGFSILVVLPSNLSANPSIDVRSMSEGVTMYQDSNHTEFTATKDISSVNCNRFDIPAEHSARINQPSGDSIFLARVFSHDKSQIDGRLSSNGKFILVNQNGIVFGPTAKVDVNGLIASTIDIDDKELYKEDNNLFEKGRVLQFNKSTNNSSEIINYGNITAADAGVVGLVAPRVENHGTIIANEGTVQLASGNKFTLDLYGDKLIEIAVEDDLKGQLIKNKGLIRASGGKVILSAASGKTIVDSLIVVDGSIEAKTVGTKNGEIHIFAEGSNAVKENIAENKGLISGESKVYVNGKLITTANQAGESGGNISVLGDQIALLPDATIDASGFDGEYDTTKDQLASSVRTNSSGGEIKIGGDYKGSGNTPTAKYVYFDENAVISNDSINSGDAGRTILWSDHTTLAYGSIYSMALGSNPGNGGFVETSGKEFIDAHLKDINLTSTNGETGTYLTDPTNIKIVAATPTFISTDSSINLSENKQLWLDANTPNQIMVKYVMSVSSTGSPYLVISAVSGSNTITVDRNIDTLQVGQIINLSASAPSEEFAANILSQDGNNFYTIQSISGNTITLTSPISSYPPLPADARINVAKVETWQDISGNTYHATQLDPNYQPTILFKTANGRPVIDFGSGKGMDVYLGFMNDPTSGYNSVPHTNFVAAKTTTYGSFYQQVATGGSVYEGFRNDLTPNPQYRMDYTLGDNTIYNMNAADYVTGSIAPTSAFLSDSYNIMTYKWEREREVIDGSDHFDYPNTKEIFANTNLELTQDPAGTIGPYTTGSGKIGYGDAGTAWNGNMAEIIMYNTPLSTDNINLINQYLSAKWDIKLSPPGSGSTEAAKAMASTVKGDARDGYSVFDMNYLKRISASAHIDLEASGNISFDPKDATVALASGKNFSVKSTTGNISSLSSGGIVTSGGGNINFEATQGTIDVHHLTLRTGTSGRISFTTGGSIPLTNSLTIGSKTPRSIEIPSTLFGSKTYDGSTDFSGSLEGTAPSVLKYSGTATLSSANSGIETPSLTRFSMNLSSSNGAAGVYSITGAPTTVSITTNRAPLSVTADNFKINYGQTPDLTYTYSGLIGSDSSAGFIGNLAFPDNSVGSHPILQGSLRALGNYSIAVYKPGIGIVAAPTASSLSSVIPSSTFNQIIASSTQIPVSPGSSIANGGFNGSIVNPFQAKEQKTDVIEFSF